MCSFSQIRGGGVLYNHSRRKKGRRIWNPKLDGHSEPQHKCQIHNIDQNVGKMMKTKYT